MTFYRHLAEVGRRWPGTVVEAGVFSHAYIEGPILYNAWEQGAPLKQGKRDPLDCDLRSRDWDPATWTPIRARHRPDLAMVKAAFRADAFLKVWGCNSNLPLRRALVDMERRQDASDDGFVPVRIVGREGTHLLNSRPSSRSAACATRGCGMGGDKPLPYTSGQVRVPWSAVETCPWCCEPNDDPLRCRVCGTLLQEPGRAAPEGYPRDSLMVATICVLCTAVLMGMALA